MLRESVGESATHSTVKSAKKSLQALLLMSLVSSSDALSLPSPITGKWFSIEFPSFSSWMLCLVILFCIWLLALVVVPQRSLLADEPESESQLNEQASTSSRSFNTIAVYGFLALCVKRCLELLSDAEFEQNDSAVGQLNATYDVLIDTHVLFENDGITSATLRYSDMIPCLMLSVLLQLVVPQQLVVVPQQRTKVDLKEVLKNRTVSPCCLLILLATLSINLHQSHTSHTVQNTWPCGWLKS